MEKKKTIVEDIKRDLYDIKNPDQDSYHITRGLTKEIVSEISAFKNEPSWMLDLRLASLETYHSMAMPKWGPSLHELNMDEIVTYVQPKASAKESWEDVPREIKETFERLGIPEAERKSLAGVGAQYDSEVVYHSIKEELTKQGVV